MKFNSAVPSRLFLLACILALGGVQRVWPEALTIGAMHHHWKAVDNWDGINPADCGAASRQEASAGGHGNRR